MSFFFNFEGVLLMMRGCACVLRGCSCTHKPLILRPWVSVSFATESTAAPHHVGLA